MGDKDGVLGLCLHLVDMAEQYLERARLANDAPDLLVGLGISQFPLHLDQYRQRLRHGRHLLGQGDVEIGRQNVALLLDQIVSQDRDFDVIIGVPLVAVVVQGKMEHQFTSSAADARSRQIGLLANHTAGWSGNGPSSSAV